MLALAVYDGYLVAGGRFTRAGSIAASNIARWDGAAWSPLGSGTDGDVLTLTVQDGLLIATGRFTTAGGVPAQNVARWDGTGWSPLGDGTPAAPVSIATSGREPSVREGTHVFRRSEERCEPRDTGGFARIFASCMHEGTLFAAGQWAASDGDGDSCIVIASQDHDRWVVTFAEPCLPANICHGAEPHLLTSLAGRLFAGWWGHPRLLVYTGVWTSISHNHPAYETCGSIDSVTLYGEDVVVGGYYRTGGAAPSYSIAIWDGAQYHTLGSGIVHPLLEVGLHAGRVYAAAEFQGSLFVAGIFPFAGGRASSNIARWDP